MTPTTREDRDAALLRALHDEHSGALWSFVMHLTGGDRFRSEEVVQETLLRAWRQPSVLRGEHDAPRSWLLTVARNIVTDQWRARRRRPEDVREFVPEPAGTFDRNATDAALEKMLVGEALRRLTLDHRAVLVECYYLGCTAPAAAERLGIPVGTVKSRLHYGLHALRLVLQEMGVVSP